MFLETWEPGWRRRRASGGERPAHSVGEYYNAHSEREKRWSGAVLETKLHGYPDVAIDGPPCALHMYQHLCRHGGDPPQRLTNFQVEKSRPPNDCSAREMKVLCEAFTSQNLRPDELGRCTIEVLSRRLASIVDALSVSGPPSWDTARYFEGIDSIDDAAGERSRVSSFGRRQKFLENKRTRTRNLGRAPDSGSSLEDDDRTGDHSRRDVTEDADGKL